MSKADIVESTRLVNGMIIKRFTDEGELILEQCNCNSLETVIKFYSWPSEAEFKKNADETTVAFWRIKYKRDNQ